MEQLESGSKLLNWTAFSELKIKEADSVYLK